MGSRLSLEGRLKMINKFKDNPVLVLKRIKMIINDYEQIAEEETHIDKNGYTQHTDKYDENLDQTFSIVKDIVHKVEE